MAAAPPRGERCAVCGGVDVSLPHQANCSHWFCGHCIVGVWLHGSVRRPSDFPLCRRPITPLVPSEVASLLRDEPEIAPVVDRIRAVQWAFHWSSSQSDSVVAGPALLYQEDADRI